MVATLDFAAPDTSGALMPLSGETSALQLQPLAKPFCARGAVKPKGHRHVFQGQAQINTNRQFALVLASRLFPGHQFVEITVGAAHALKITDFLIIVL